MKIIEVFTSIEGESSYAGLPCMFIRVSGCNLRCGYCDTTYAYEGGNEYSFNDLMTEAERSGVRLVHLTGGEPLLSPESPELVQRLLDAGYDVLIETNGSVPIEGLDQRAVVIMDIKTPGSSMSGRMLYGNIGHIKKTDEVKFVLTGKADYLWAKEVCEKYSIWDKCHVLFSPAYGMMDPKELASLILADRLRVRLNLQIHKYIYGPEQRGV